MAQKSNWISVREGIVNSEWFWQILGKCGFLCLPEGEGFCIVRAKAESLMLSLTRLMQLRKRVNDWFLDLLEIPSFIQDAASSRIRIWTPGTGQPSAVLYACEMHQTGVRTTAERQRLCDGADTNCHILA